MSDDKNQPDSSENDSASDTEKPPHPLGPKFERWVREIEQGEGA